MFYVCMSSAGQNALKCTDFDVKFEDFVGQCPLGIGYSVLSSLQP